MSSNYIVPTFNKFSPKEVDNILIETWSSTGCHSHHPAGNGGWLSAIGTESILATVDGEYVFAIRIDNIGDADILIGVTPMETFDSNKERFSLFNPSSEMNGAALSVNIGRSHFTKKAKEVIVVVTISNRFTGGLYRRESLSRSIRWIVDGTSTKNRDCTKQCKGDKLFPVISLRGQDSQFTTIPIDQITIRNNEINKLIEKCAKQSSTNQGAVANNNQQQASSAAFAQLQQELDKERKRADLAETQRQDERKQAETKLQHEKQQHETEKQGSAAKDQAIQRKEQDIQDEKTKASNLMTEVNQKDQQLQQQSLEMNQLKQQLLTLQSQVNNNNNSPSSPFVKDKLYQIDFAANGLALPTDRSTFGALLPVAQTSPIFLEAKKLMRKFGSFYPSQKPVAGFTLEGIDIIAKSVAGFEDVLHNLQQFRTHGGGIFNPSTTKYSAEQLQVLIYLNKLPSDAHDKAPDLINVFHGTKRGVLQSAVNGLVAVRSTDAGFFGLGAYTTPNIEYAARYAMGEFNPTSSDFTPRGDGSFPVIWCVAAVGVCYPLTREKDYGQNKQWNGMNVSDFFGSPLKSDANGKFDCQCVLVNESANYQAVPRHEMQYMEIVFDQTSQVLPIAVLWMKPV